MFGHSYTNVTRKTPWQPDGVAWLPTKDVITGKIFWLKRKCVRFVGIPCTNIAWNEYTTEINAAWDIMNHAH